MATDSRSNIHYRRRWYYALWVLLLAGVAGFGWWYRRPAFDAQARFTMVLDVQQLPGAARAGLWIGQAGTFDPTHLSPLEWRPVDGGHVVVTGMVRLVGRRFRQGYYLDRTDDLAVLVMEAGGQRRCLVYDLREDIRDRLVAPGKKLTLTMSPAWAVLDTTPRLPDPARRVYIGW